ncbi:hypothetical protein ABZ348_02990 [Streptomyces sp. NPDC005963]|uniref:hypothetical protein n=1 Tax=Streptomyces sp. NPDC005963 TaxID=3156721 RepID=UPI0033DC2661
MPTGTVPTPLRAGLETLGATRRVANPWLWDAISTAILRQVVRASQARKLYRTLCGTYGIAVDTRYGRLDVAPDPERVLALGDDQFATVSASFTAARCKRPRPTTNSTLHSGTAWLLPTWPSR